MAKTCAVVGAGPGIGLSVARRFAREGFGVALLARTKARLADHVKLINDEGGLARAFHADCSVPAQVRESLRTVSSEMGPPSVLVYNAAAVRPGLPSSLPASRLLDELKINVVSALAATQAVLTAMEEAGEGTVIFTGGGLALDPWPEMASLAVGKAGIRSLAMTLGKELKPKGIHVATVTVCGIVDKGGKFDPDTIAEAYWELHTQSPDAWELERTIA
jgi:short-subunit dehydrogenase